jgi:hypothetical protein
VTVNQSALAAQGPIKFLIKELVMSGHISESVANRTALSTMKHIAAVRQAHLVHVSVIYVIIRLSFRLSNDATNRKVVGSIHDEVIFLNLPNPSGCTTPWVLLSL